MYHPSVAYFFCYAFIVLHRFPFGGGVSICVYIGMMPETRVY